MNLVNNNEKQIIRKLLIWYKKNKRNLPWRILSKNSLPNPYYIMVSEFMLQQTTVNSVIRKFNEFVKIWPNIKSLSKAKEVQILKIWSGLGYYVRAKNLLRSIKIISRNNNNFIPKTYNDLIKLPGIGDYTAKAILGIAYNKPVMPVDTNIKRIITRVYGLSKPITLIKDDILYYSTKLISKKQTNNLVQAFMDYGSLICLPNRPKCKECILISHCIAFKKNLTNLIPAKNKKSKIKPQKMTRAYVILNDQKEILVRRRSSLGMLQSMLEVPNDRWEVNNKLLRKDHVAELVSKKYSIINDKFIYSFSHFDLIVKIFYTLIKKRKIKNHFWISLKKIPQSGMPTIMKKIISIYKSSIER